MATKQPSADDRRAEPRRRAAGKVWLRDLQAPAAAFAGRLMDVAARGFRACHHRVALKSGDLVDFEFAGHSGRARAMWTRIVGGKVETGFRICQEGGPVRESGSPDPKI